MKVRLLNPVQAHQVLTDLWPKIKAYLIAGHSLTLALEKEKRSLDQNAMFHAIIGSVAKQAQHMGAKWDAESWKRLLVDAWARETGRTVGKIVPNLTGDGIVQLGMQTRTFDKETASEFTEWLMAWCAENGVEHDVPEV